MLHWSAAERVLKMVFTFLTGVSSIVVALVAWLALQEARNQWVSVPAPENVRGALYEGAVRLTWEPPQRHSDMVRYFEVLPCTNQEPWGERKQVDLLPADVRLRSVPFCDHAAEAPHMICMFRVRAIGWNDRAGTLSRRVVCTAGKCGYVPSSDEEIVWQDDYD